MIDYVKGDATAPPGEGNRIIAHVCNDIGGWGRGFVVALSRRWPEPEQRYREWHRDGAGFELGAVQLVQVEPAIWVANMVAQRGLKATADGPPIRYAAVERCMSGVAEHARQRSASVHMPRIGCGLAGGRWEEIEPILQRTLVAAGIHVTVHDL